MKTMKCDCCKREREVEDNIIMSVCYSCQKEMEVKDGKLH